MAKPSGAKRQPQALKRQRIEPRRRICSRRPRNREAAAAAAVAVSSHLRLPQSERQRLPRLALCAPPPTCASRAASTTSRTFARTTKKRGFAVLGTTAFTCTTAATTKLAGSLSANGKKDSEREQRPWARAKSAKLRATVRIHKTNLSRTTRALSASCHSRRRWSRHSAIIGFVSGVPSRTTPRIVDALCVGPKREACSTR
mmetsp:Transcript_8497/g.27021  ORF Transcript_8497/g.27021 Transcript_8497/m.27021 type:complete len:201 (+) Transcript_8497:308-910(+)